MASSAHSGTKHSTIEQLNEKNFSQWRLNMYGWMLEHDLVSFISDPHPTVPAIDSPLYAEFIKHRNRASGVILQRIDQASKTRFVTNDNILNPNLLWDSILAHYQASDAASQSRIFLNFLRITFSSLSQFIKDIRQGMTDLVDCNVTNDIGDGLLAEIIVHKLPDAMSTFKELMYSKRPLITSSVLTALDDHFADEEENKNKPDSSALSSRRNGPSSNAVNNRNNNSGNRSSNSSGRNFCSNGVHNPLTKHHRDNCWTVFPDKRPANLRQRATPAVNNVNSSRYVDDNIFSVQNASAAYVGAVHSSDFNPPYRSRALAVNTTPFAKLLDSGCSDHMTSNIDDFTTYLPKRSTVSLADGSIIDIIGEGLIHGSSNGAVNSFHAFHVPKVNGTLLSLGKLMLEGCSLHSIEDSFVVKKKDSPILHGSIRDGVLELDLKLDFPVIQTRSV